MNWRVYGTGSIDTHGMEGIGDTLGILQIFSVGMVVAGHVQRHVDVLESIS